MTCRYIARIASAVCALGFLTPACAQTFPAKTVTIIVPFVTGGSTDVMTRIVAQRYAEIVGQPVIVENRGGGSGTAGAVAVKQAAADGYTLLAANPPILVGNLLLSSNMPYTTTDFAPVQLMYKTVTFLYVPASSPAASISELVALARKKPGGLSYASQGLGTSGHLGGAALQALTGAQFVHVPYKGSGQGMVDLAAGRVDMFFSVTATAAPFVKAGSVKTLAVAAATRSKALPNLPTTVESGYPELILDTWFGLFAPAGTPASIINKLNEDLRMAVLSPEVTRKLSDQNLDPVNATPAEISKMLVADRIRFERAYKAAGLRKE